jgi:pre-mRNA-splicing factor RBM22/SLT11
LKNVCQTCVLDLEFGLPVQVRDSTLEDFDKVTLPISDANRGFMMEQKEKAMDTVGGDEGYGKVPTGATTLLNKLAKRTPYYKRNLPHLCSFYAKGACTRGDTCPYRHEMPTVGELANQNIKDRYHGNNDPVARKMLNRSGNDPRPMELPEDRTITTIWVGGLDESMTESDVRMPFEECGALSSVRLVPQKQCAFVTFAKRAEAEEAARKLHNNLRVKGHSLRIAWGRRQAQDAKTQAPVTGGHGTGVPLVVNPGSTAHLSAPSEVTGPPPPGSVPPPPPGMRRPSEYPSMNPSNMSTRLS